MANKFLKNDALLGLLDEDSPMTKREAFLFGVEAERMRSGWMEYDRVAGERGFPCVKKKKLAAREKEFLDRGQELSKFLTEVDKRSIEDVGYRRSAPRPPPYSWEQPKSQPRDTYPRSGDSYSRSGYSYSRSRDSYSRSRDTYSGSEYDSYSDRGFDSGDEYCRPPATRSGSSRHQPRRICY